MEVNIEDTTNDEEEDEENEAELTEEWENLVISCEGENEASNWSTEH